MSKFPLTKEKKYACIENYTAECDGGKTTWLKGYIYTNNEGHIGLSGSCLETRMVDKECAKHFIEVKDTEYDKKYFELYSEGKPMDYPSRYATQLKFDFWKEEEKYICIKDTTIDYGGVNSKYNPVWKEGNIYLYKSGWDHSFVTSETKGGGYYINSLKDFEKVNVVKFTDYNYSLLKKNN